MKDRKHGKGSQKAQNDLQTIGIAKSHADNIKKVIIKFYKNDNKNMKKEQ